MDKPTSLIVFTQEQYDEIEQLSGSNFSVEDIAVFFNINKAAFVDAFNANDSLIKYHYDRGALLVKAHANMELYKSAKTGNVTSIQQLDKARAFNKLEQAKKKAQLSVEHNKLDKLQSFLQSKHKKELDSDMVIYYEQLDLVRSLWQKGHTKTFIHNALFSSFPDLTLYRVRILFDDAINFFYLDSGIKKQAWANYYADFLDSMAKICYEMADFNQARLLTKDAAEMRQVHLPDNPNDDNSDSCKIFVYTLDPENLGLPKANRAKLAKFIDGLEDISESGRDRLHIETMDGKGVGNIMNIPIDDIDYIENNNETAQ